MDDRSLGERRDPRVGAREGDRVGARVGNAVATVGPPHAEKALASPVLAGERLVMCSSRGEARVEEERSGLMPPAEPPGVSRGGRRPGSDVSCDEWPRCAEGCGPSSATNELRGDERARAMSRVGGVGMRGCGFIGFSAATAGGQWREEPSGGMARFQLSGDAGVAVEKA